jgi:hypothetical protein
MPEHLSLPIVASLVDTSAAQLTNWSVLPTSSGLSSGGPVDSHSAAYIEQSYFWSAYVAREIFPATGVRQVPLPPASGCERAYAMNLLARIQGERRSLLQAWAYWRNVVSICRKHRQISMSPMQWFYI